MTKIVQLKTANASVLADIRRLLRQVHSYSVSNTVMMSELRNALRSESTFIIVAKDGEHIVGMALLCVIMRIDKRTGQIEDVVVDDGYRGKGIGKMLMQTLIALARKKKLKAIYLTSRPARVAANALYQKIGFKQKETNVYRLEF